MEIKKLGQAFAFSALGFLSANAYASEHTLYAMSNNPSGNVVSVVKQAQDGSLSLVASYSTGGTGSGVGRSVPPDPLGSQNAILLSQNRRWLYVANPGSNEISTFRVQGDSLQLVSITNSGGEYPTSIAQRGNFVYVLNARNTPNITGFRQSFDGGLTQIQSSTRRLPTISQSVGTQPHVLDDPSEVLYSPDGRWLVVADKNLTTSGTIEVFPVGRDGYVGPGSVTTVSNDVAPFGYTFDAEGHLLVTEAISGAITEYQLNRDGTLTQLSRVLTGQLATCWIETTRNGFAYATNTRSSTLTGVRVGPGTSGLTMLNSDGITAAVGAGTAPVEVRISPDSEYLYTIAAGAGSIISYRIDRQTGALTRGSEIHLNPGLSGMVGLAVR